MGEDILEEEGNRKKGEERQEKRKGMKKLCFISDSISHRYTTAS